MYLLIFVVTILLYIFYLIYITSVIIIISNNLLSKHRWCVWMAIICLQISRSVFAGEVEGGEKHKTKTKTKKGRPVCVFRVQT